MKKTILLLVVLAVGLSSCSKDDDPIEDNRIEVDKIIGLWGNYKDVDLTDGYIWNWDPNEIENQIEFLEDGSLKSHIDETTYIEGTWENLKNGTYKMVYMGITEIITIDFVGNDMIFRYTDEEIYWKRII